MEEASQIIPLGLLAAIMKKRQKVVSGEDTPGYLHGWEKALCWKESIEPTSSIGLGSLFDECLILTLRSH